MVETFPRTLPKSRSQVAFAFGARQSVFKTSMDLPTGIRMKVSPDLLSRSRIKKARRMTETWRFAQLLSNPIHPSVNA